MEGTTLAGINNSKIELCYRDFCQYAWLRYFQMLFYPLMFLVGVIGNTLSFIVCMRPTLRRQPTFNSLVALALADFVLNWTDPLWWWFKLVTANTFEKYFVPNWLCKVRYYMRTACSQTSAWLIVLITIERLICTTFPLKVSRIMTRRVNFLSIIAIFFVNMVSSIYVLWAAELNNGGCWGSKQYQHLWIIRSQLLSVFYSYIPLTLIITLNILIIYKLKQSIISANINSQSTISKRQKATTKTLVLISALFVTNTLPLVIVNPFQKKATLERKKLGDAVTQKDEDHYRQLSSIYGISLLLMATNHAVNIFVYCIRGRTFRNQLMKALKCKSEKECSRKALHESAAQRKQEKLSTKRQEREQLEFTNPKAQNSIEILSSGTG